MEAVALGFRELSDLRLFLLELRGRQVGSLSEYFDPETGGFYHRHDKKTAGKLSKSSTATCVLSLIKANQWSDGPWGAATGTLVSSLLNSKWQSAGLDENNLFTVSFILEAVNELIELTERGPEEKRISLDAASKQRLDKARTLLVDAANKRPVELSVQGYPTSSYIAQLVVRTLRKQDVLTADSVLSISEWAEHEINRQIALLTRNDKTADVFQLAYAAILFTNLVEPASLTPDQEFVIEAALEVLFEHQRADGTWPLSRPLFHYPDVGSAHCYDYEMLVQLLTEQRLHDKLLRFIPKLAKSAWALRSYFPLGSEVPPTGRGWSSGHHPQLRGPESWSTASVYHFAYAFERLIAEQIRIETFAYLGSPYTPPRSPPTYDGSLGDDFLDCPVYLSGTQRSLKEEVGRVVLQPLVAAERERLIERGSRLPATTPMSIIFFGPPGTSKTDLADRVARSVGWPLLTVDASQFLKHGMDGVYAEADRIFSMLAIAERVVVLLDEFDEMVRARETAPDILSRFLTTAMLPKLVKINKNRRLVFIVATNHIDWFDAAIRRPGRFDVILQVLPPSAGQKLRTWKGLGSLMGGGDDESITKKLEPLTYLETVLLADRLDKAQDRAEKIGLLNEAYEKCTLRSPVQASDVAGEAPISESPRARWRIPAVWRRVKTWEDLCKQQRVLSRVP